MRITQTEAPQSLRGAPDATQQISSVLLPRQSKEPRESPIKVFIVSDVRLHRDGLSSLLQGCPSIQVLGGDTRRGALVSLRTAVADVALLDAPQPADCCLALRQVRPQLRMLVLGSPGIASEGLSCAAAHIDGYIRIDATVAQVLCAIGAIVHGESLCSPEATASLYHGSRTDRLPHTMPLTARELQVADLLNLGLPTKQIARYLGVRPCTAKNHVRNILQKLDVHCRGQAAAKLRRLMDGLLGGWRS
jgi:DNA-binding NarL/FixJ family response regulator